jgi:type I restriction enzyme M protein
LLNLISFNNSRFIQKESSLGFRIDAAKISDGILCPRYYDPQAEKEITALKKSHTLLSIKDLLFDGTLTISTGDEVGKLAYGTGNIPFIRTSDISNWELKADPKHGVSNEIYDSLAVKQDVAAGDILMVKDGTYLIGTCAIVTSADEKILYQSHLYKIRVHKNNHGLNEYLLLALLSSSAVQKQIRSKQFTQDIIDSLGSRITELVLPIPKLKEDQKRISDLVKQSVKKRIEARELAKLARELIDI